MEFFGLTSYGFSSPIKDMLRPDYIEPKEPPKTSVQTSGRKLCESIKELDCYIGNTDGYAYGSQDRLIRMRKKYVIKPVGPYDMYQYPGLTSMEHGWWISDPKLTSEWYKVRMLHSVTTSAMSRFMNHCLTVDKSNKW